MGEVMITKDEFDEAVALVIQLWSIDGSVKDMGAVRKGEIAAGHAAALMLDYEAKPMVFIPEKIAATVEKAMSGDALADATCRIALAAALRNGIEVPKALSDFSIQAITSDRPKSNENAENPDIGARNKFIVWAIRCVVHRTKLKATRSRYKSRKDSACDAVALALHEKFGCGALKYDTVEKIWFARVDK